jgi:chromate transporter
MKPTLLETTKTALKIGLLSFGGPAGQIALMHKIYVEEKKWLDEKQFLNALNFCMLLPGPEAQQLSTYIGWLHHGVRGGLITGLLFILPGALLIFALATLYAFYQNTALLNSLFFGLKAAILAVVIEALLRVSKKALKGKAHYLIALAAFLGLYLFKLPFPLIIFGAGLIGFFFLAKGETKPTKPMNHKNLAFTLGLGIALLALPFWLFPKGIYSDVTIFFTKMAFVTFGGAYAVLAYVAQQAVEQ